MLLLDTLPMLGNVLLLCFFVFFIFGIVGVQLWAGVGHFLFLTENHHLLQVFSDNAAISMRHTNAISLA